MKNIKSLDFFCTACLSIIFLGTFSVGARAVTRIFVKKNICPTVLSQIVFFDREDLRSVADSQKQSESDEPLESVNWKELFPFETEEKENTIAKTKTKNSENLQNKCNIKLDFLFAEKMKSEINTWFDKKFPLIDFWINFSYKLTKFFVGNMINSNSSIITLDNDKEHFSNYSSKMDVSLHAKAIIELDEFLKQNGIPFLYVQGPFKISPLDYEAGLIDFSNQNVDEFLKLLKENDVNFIDMREEFLKTGKNFHDFFYKTSHHWKPEAGLFACPIIAERANAIAGTKIDVSVFDPQNFDFEVFENSFLGGLGRALTLANAKMESTTLITPKNDYNLQTEIYSMRERIRKASGGFETFIFKEHLQTRKTALKSDAYELYMGGSKNEFIKNNSCDNDYRVLFLGDSFTNMVEPFFALSVKNFDSLDLRAFDGSFKNYVQKNKPYDICVGS